MINTSFCLKTLFLLSILSFNNIFAQQPSTQPVRNTFTGNYSSEGDINQKGILTFELTTTGKKIQGVANYKTFNGQISTGVLSVNGYTLLGKAFIRFRDQRGKTLADGVLSFNSNQMMIFQQTTNSSRLPKTSVLQKSYGNNSPQPPTAPKKINGKYSTTGDANGSNFTMELTENLGKISGTANYNAGYGQNNSGVLSVLGNVEGTRSYVKFLDQRGNMVAEGSLLVNSSNEIIFTQNSNSVLLPMTAKLNRRQY